MPGEIDFQAHGGETTRNFCSEFVRSTFRAGISMEAHGLLQSLMNKVLSVVNTGLQDL